MHRIEDSRWNGGFPKVGIRPTIDGRLGGVRESLEKQTRRQAEAVARLISSELRYPNGQPVECVIADGTIGGVAEAAACADSFAREGVGVSLTVTPCWCYGSETMDMDPLRAQGGVGLQRHRAARGGLPGRRARRPHPEGPARLRHLRPRRAGRRATRRIPADVREKILRFVRAGLAVATDARQVLPVHGRRARWASPARSSTSPSSSSTSACGSRRST